MADWLIDGPQDSNDKIFDFCYFLVRRLHQCDGKAILQKNTNFRDNIVISKPLFADMLPYLV